MKLPEPPPNWHAIFSKHTDWFFKNINNDRLIRIAHHANREYIYWDRVKYITLPEGVTPELFWLFLKFKRSGQMKKIPLLDIRQANFNYILTEELLRGLHYIDTHSANNAIFGASLSRPDRERYLINSLMEEAIASSQLEGAATTREIAKIMLRTGDKPKDVHQRMILNNYVTMQELKKFSEKPLTSELIKLIQATITKDTLEKTDASGRFRCNNEDDNVSVVDGRDNTVLFEPPPFDEIENRIKILCDFVNNNDKRDEFLHPVIKAIIIHFWLSYIHPFVDGNGRTARALFYWYLIKNGYWKFEYLSLSRILKKAPAQYARAFLYSEIDENDMTYFLSYNLKSIQEAITDFDAYIKRKAREQQKLVSLTRYQHGLNLRQAELVERALNDHNYSCTVKKVQNTFQVVHQTARIDLIGLVKKKLFVKKRIGREFYFSPVEDIKEKMT